MMIEVQVKRDKRMATKGWFVICKHARQVSREQKSKYAAKLWRYTSATATRSECCTRAKSMNGAIVH